MDGRLNPGKILDYIIGIRVYISFRVPINGS